MFGLVCVKARWLSDSSELSKSPRHLQVAGKAAVLVGGEVPGKVVPLQLGEQELADALSYSNGEPADRVAAALKHLQGRAAAVAEAATDDDSR